GFRDREQAVIDELCRRDGIVLATGGGVVMRAQSRVRLCESGSVVYLYAALETLWQRLRNSRHRPMLQAADPRNRLVELYKLRDPVYREVATHVIEADRGARILFIP